MSKYLDDIAKVLESAEEAAYQQGWDDCAAAISTAASRIKAPQTQTEMPLRVPSVRKAKGQAAKGKPAKRLPRGSAEGYVIEMIRNRPGLRGTALADALDGIINKHTVRTVLRRALADGKIEQDDNDGWHAKGHGRRQAA